MACISEKRKCQVDGCDKYDQSRGRCFQHGGGLRCQVYGCDKGGLKGGRCSKHGGGIRCQAYGCEKGGLRGGKCVKHGGGPRCKVNGCDNYVQKIGKCFQCRRDGVVWRPRAVYDFSPGPPAPTTFIPSSAKFSLNFIMN